jgi:ABC-type amino acid transport substrate-binding protein
MTDDRLRRWLEAAEQPLAPDPAFAVALRDELRQELGFIPADSATNVFRHVGRTNVRARRGPGQFLLVAALVVAGAVGFAAVAGSLLERAIERPSDLLAEIRDSGRIRIAVSPDHPQFSAPGQPAAGFDVDVARALADHLGVRGDVVLLDAPVILAGSEDDHWDVALPSVAAWDIDDPRFVVSSAYYYWPHRLVVAEESAAAVPGDLTGEPICAVSGDAGEGWLRGQYGGTTSAPITTRVVTKSSDDECLAALASGDAAAIVTAGLSDADLQVRSGIKVIGGPDAEPRAVIIRRSGEGTSGPEALLLAIDDALDEMRRDGTLTQLSQNRFGGFDLTAP